MSENTEKNLDKVENADTNSSEALNKKKKNSPGAMKKIVALVVALVLVIGSIFIIMGFSAPPKYEDIEERFEQLIDDSYGVNVILFGEGLPTYERVSDPLDSLKFYNTGEKYSDDGVEKERRVSYYYTLRPKGDTKTVIAYRNSNAYTEDYSYAYVSNGEKSANELSELFPPIDGISPKEGQVFYSEVFRSEDGKDICYLVPYVELKYDYYYLDTDPKNYDYVSYESEYRTIQEIKKYAETVYSDNYLFSLYGTLFDGVASGDTVLLARYTEYISSGNARLAQLNTYEPLFTERRVYDFDTAKIIKWGSNRTHVRISIKSYLPSDPENVYDDEINLAYDDGEWYLDSPTF